MSAPSIRRRLREHFGISAPRMTVRTSLPWWERGAAIAIAGVLVGGLVWIAFVMGQIEGRASAHGIEARIAATPVAATQLDETLLRTRNSALESDLAMSRGAVQALSRQVEDSAAENAKLKEEILVLKRLLDDGAKPGASRRVH